MNESESAGAEGPSNPPAKASAGDIVQQTLGHENRMAPRVVSLIMLIAVVLLTLAMFFRVMVQFVAPLFLAGVLVVIYEPVHVRVVSRLPDRPRLSAAVTTLIAVFSLLLPITWLGVNAFFELAAVVRPFVEASPEFAGEVAEGVDPAAELIARIREEGADSVAWYEETFNQDFDSQLRRFSSQLAETVLATGVHTVIWIIGFLFGLGIMAFSLYYFFADGPAMIEAFVNLSPLDDKYERELLEQFAQVSRAVVVATLLAAVAQGLMAGIAYYFVLDEGPIFLLTAATMLLAIVPFVGATIVWVPVVAWVYFYQGDMWSALGLFLWCAIAVSNIDNIIKPMVLHGQSNLHPLLALLSVLGGVSVLGPVGILVGPMLVAFLQSLLNMLRKELDGLQRDKLAAEPNGAADGPPDPAKPPEPTAEKSTEPHQATPDPDAAS